MWLEGVHMDVRFRKIDLPRPPARRRVRTTCWSFSISAYSSTGVFEFHFVEILGSPAAACKPFGAAGGDAAVVDKAPFLSGWICHLPGVVSPGLQCPSGSGTKECCYGFGCCLPCNACHLNFAAKALVFQGLLRVSPSNVI